VLGVLRNKLVPTYFYFVFSHPSFVGFVFSPQKKTFNGGGNQKPKWFSPPPRCERVGVGFAFFFFFCGFSPTICCFVLVWVLTPPHPHLVGFLSPGGFGKTILLFVVTNFFFFGGGAALFFPFVFFFSHTKGKGLTKTL